MFKTMNEMSDLEIPTKFLSQVTAIVYNELQIQLIYPDITFIAIKTRTRVGGSEMAIQNYQS